MRKTNMALAMVLAVSLVACGGSSESGSTDETTAPAEAAEAAPADAPASPSRPATAAADTSLKLEEIDAYVRGVTKEIELLKAASEKVEQARAAKDDEAELSAIMEMAGGFDEAAAEAAGLPLERWKDVQRKIIATVGGVDTRRQMQDMAGNTEGMTPEQVAEHQRNAEQMLASIPDPYAGLGPEVVEALKARHDELARLNAESIGVRMGAR